METFSQALLFWFDQHGRKNLPWQQAITPYTVWLSEIMLQQTQVATVIPYFQAFLKHYPTVQQLAQASEDEVLHQWTGLGYYRRARYLHKTAQIITHEHQGVFPNTLETLCALPGIGRSTAGAILSIAMGKPTPILDGNVKRVLTRYRAIAGATGEATINKKLWQLASDYTPTTRAADYTQAIMDLGATLCTRTQPNCPACPLAKDCLGYQQGNPTDYPSKRKKKSLPIKTTQMIILICEKTQCIWLEKRPPMGIWAGLWSLPECEENQDIQAWCQTHLGFTPKTIHPDKPFKHAFTHFHLNIHPIRVSMPNSNNKTLLMEDRQQIWYDANNPATIGLPAPIKKLLHNLSKT